MDLIELGRYGAAFVALAGAATVGWKVWVRAVMSVVHVAIEQVQQAQMEADKDYAEAIDEVRSRLTSIGETLDDVRSQVYANSGSSLRDRVDALYDLVLHS